MFNVASFLGVVLSIIIFFLFCGLILLYFALLIARLYSYDKFVIQTVSFKTYIKNFLFDCLGVLIIFGLIYFLGFAISKEKIEVADIPHSVQYIVPQDNKYYESYTVGEDNDILKYRWFYKSSSGKIKNQSASSTQTYFYTTKDEEKPRAEWFKVKEKSLLFYTEKQIVNVYLPE